MASTKVEIRDNRELRRVEALNEDGEVAGFAEYQIGLDGSTFDFHHTEVDERFQGQGLGSELASGVLEFVRAENLKVIPSCSFIRSWMAEHEESHDLLAEEGSLESDDGLVPEEDDEENPDEAKDQADDGQAEDNDDDRADDDADDSQAEDNAEDRADDGADDGDADRPADESSQDTEDTDASDDDNNDSDENDEESSRS